MRTRISISFLLFLIVMTLADTGNIQLKMHQIYTVNQTGNTYANYSLSMINTTKDYFLVTATANTQTQVDIYISTDPTNPQPHSYNYTYACYSLKLVTCGFKMTEENKPSTVYFSVYTNKNTTTSIESDLFNTYPLKIGKYRATFNNSQTILIELKNQDFEKFSNLTLLADYSAFDTTGKFDMIAALNVLPSSTYDAIYSSAVGAFQRLLKLPNSQDTSSYYIIIQAQNGTQIDLLLMPSNNSLYINSTKYDIVYDNTDLTFNHVFGASPTNPLFVQLDAYGGLGKFNVDYCDGLEKFTFENTNGQNGQIFIPVSRRQLCFNNSGGLLIQNFIVSLVGVGWKFSYSVGIYEGNYPLYVMPQKKTYGILSKEIIYRNYELMFSKGVNVFIECDIISVNNTTPNITFTLFQCLNYTQSNDSSIKQGKNCTSSSINTGTFNSFTLADTSNYSYIHVEKANTSDQFAQFVIQLTIPSFERSTLSLNKVTKGIVSMNSYDYYTLPVASLGLPANSIIQITATAINGQIVMLGSTKQDTPTFNMVYSDNSSVSYAWDGVLLFMLNDSIKNIYIGILGDSQSYYQIQATLDNDADITLRYKKIVEDVNNQINLVGTNVSYLMYNSHSIPYYISFYPTPSCIRYGYELPLDKACVELPKQFHEKTVYIQVLQDQALANDTFKFSVYAFSDFLYLSPDKPIFISCEQSCYEIIYLVTKAKENVSIIHQGSGSIALNGTDTQYSNTYIVLECKNDSSCIFAINASIFFSGQMQVSYASTAGVQIKWNTNSFVWSDTPKHLYLKIRKFSEINGFLIYSEGLTPSIFMNVFPIQDNYTNAINFSYPTNRSYMLSHQSNPLRRMQIVNMKEADLKKSGCYDSFVYCLVTISLYVNHTEEYDLQYSESGIGYFSSNTYEYYLPFNLPYRMSNIFSLSYFQVNFPDQIMFGRLNLKPISNCRPYILGDQGQTIYTDALAFAVEKKVNFSIVSNDRCLYYITLSSSFYKTVIPNVLYQMTFIPDNENKFIEFLYDYFVTGTTITLTIQGITQNQAKDLTIYAKQNSNVSNIQIPTSKSYDFISQGISTLVIDGLSSSTIIAFKIKAHSGIALSSLSVMVQQNSKPLILIHNQEQVISIANQNQTLNFQFFSSSSYLLFLDVSSSGPIQILIKRGDITIINQTQDQASDPWITVNTSSASIRQYDILLTPKSKSVDSYPTSVKLHTQQQGNVGLLSLYNGVVLVDAFTMIKSTNCYAYHSSALVGVEDLQLDVTFAERVKQDSISYSATVTDGVIKSSMKYIGGNTFRITAPFSMLTDYQFCFTLQDYFLIGTQFYLMVDLPGMPHLPVGTIFQNVTDTSYQVYEMVNIKPKPVTLRTHIVNCLGETQLKISNSYEEMLAGRYSHAHDQWIDKDSIITVSTMPSGYFYLGLKAAQNTTYKIMTSQVSDNYTIGASNWALTTTTITNIVLDHQYVVIQLPKIAPFSKAKYSYLVYTIYIHDNQNSKTTIPSDVLPKCPELFNSNQYRNYSYFISSNKDSPVFRLKMEDLPHQFNLSAKVQWFDEQQKISTPYYYDTTIVKIKTSGWGFIPIMLFVTFAIGICCCGAAVTMYRRYKNNKKSQITFQMSPYDQNTSSPQPSKKPTSSQKKGYGQFVEEMI